MSDSKEMPSSRPMANCCSPSYTRAMSDFKDFADFRDALRIFKRFNAIKLRRYKPRLNPFMKWSDDEFRKMTTFTKDEVGKIVRIVEGDIKKANNKCNSIRAELKVVAALAIFATNKTQDEISMLFGLSQATTCRICNEVSNALVKQFPNYINFPATDGEKTETMSKFEDIAGMKNVIGVIGRTSIKLKFLKSDTTNFYTDSKGFYHLNIQAICDSKSKILDITSHWKKDSHDPSILNEDIIEGYLEHGSGYLAGDKSYEGIPFILVPISEPSSASDAEYNAVHGKTRRVIERFFKEWKLRFPFLLRGTGKSTDNITSIIYSLAVLHNIAVELREPGDGWMDKTDGFEADAEDCEASLPDVAAPKTSRKKRNIVLNKYMQEYYHLW